MIEHPAITEIERTGELTPWYLIQEEEEEDDDKGFWG